jgi:hypothetical protein|nr:hypothetical protein [Candidatus Krumholzibacteria bacterium]
MIAILQQGGWLAQMAFGLGLGGIVGVILACGAWYRRRDLTGAALRGIDEAEDAGRTGTLPLFEAGRDAALAEAQPAGGPLLMSVIVTWGLIMISMAAVTLLRQPDSRVVIDVMRGSLELPPSMTRYDYLSLVSRFLVSGSLATLMVVPMVTVSCLSLGFLRGWLLGGPLDRALLQVIARVDPEGQEEQLREYTADIMGCATRRWTVTGWLVPPLWFLWHGKLGKALKVAAAWCVAVALGLVIWYVPARIIWGGEPLIVGTDAGLIWHYLRDPLMVLAILPVCVYGGVRGNR